MKLASFKRLVKEDFSKEMHDTIDRIGYSVNNFCQQLITFSNKNITIADNLFQEIKQITLTTSQTDALLLNQVTQFKNGLTSSIKGISVIRVENLTNTTVYPSSSCQINFTESANVVTIRSVTGLEKATKYQITLITYGG